MDHPPFSDAFLEELKQISDEWLGSKKEKGFSLGFFDPAYLQKAPIAYMKNAEERSLHSQMSCRCTRKERYRLI